MKAFHFSYPMNYRKNMVASSYSGFVKRTVEFSSVFIVKKTEQVKSVENSMSCFTACGKSNVFCHAQTAATVLGVRLPFSAPVQEPGSGSSRPSVQ